MGLSVFEFCVALLYVLKLPVAIFASVTTVIYTATTIRAIKIISTSLAESKNTPIR